MGVMVGAGAHWAPAAALSFATPKTHISGTPCGPANPNPSPSPPLYPGNPQRQAVAPPDLPDHICEVVCPWWKRPYSDQLRDKHGRIKAALAAVTEEVGLAAMQAMSWRMIVFVRRRALSVPPSRALSVPPSVN